MASGGWILFVRFVVFFFLKRHGAAGNSGGGFDRGKKTKGREACRDVVPRYVVHGDLGIY